MYYLLGPICYLLLVVWIYAQSLYLALDLGIPPGDVRGLYQGSLPLGLFPHYYIINFCKIKMVLIMQLGSSFVSLLKMMLTIQEHKWI